MTSPLGSSGTVADTRQALRELIEALDKRLPHVERAGERTIASEAARLRALALERLNNLDRSDRLEAEQQTSTASDIMTDDGGRPRP